MLLRGPSGSGKSMTALTLLDLCPARGLFARLVGDDRVALAVAGGRLIASPHPSIAGRIERRGSGVESAPWLDRAAICLVVDLEPGPRLPEDLDKQVKINGVLLQRLIARPEPAGAAAAILACLGEARLDLQAKFAPNRLKNGSALHKNAGLPG